MRKKIRFEAVGYDFIRSCCSESQRVVALLLGQFAATDSDCKVHIVRSGAVPPLIEIEMLQSPEPNLREMAAFALGSQTRIVQPRL
ncbi:ARM REPEAT PROTEIN INTERACTING WITH ABF2-like [Diospyros lotus]|uniref:ARM REPEAT PROTEIN INTERACTING WITH ABF2-like n=1 Tax=Diospyros lotus TaxID=55363 RepID=UPI0022582BD6|nr:ARM REPEAT PROTEIN INTERACTING WITH ABF2-like [Diospyros lotus]XP_052211403.1 ARM REPEAT PROTEIN INTERACTING WITH ABF2-like [Diospyros lotus]XP_052211404.1 ARM REPEAT PROTEIN INTERACTING WITH ABF2-like [Diospyros lotus]XP_052211405.1 ARM REPEAT PROTEIN INTERACTING WITH ABF2-like [Diospyros lotus]XP_052211406.1 ARM REPEAT PROTEIN INTERACTING WITH ABF2-like [Diospyros lotus]